MYICNQKRFELELSSWPLVYAASPLSRSPLIEFNQLSWHSDNDDDDDERKREAPTAEHPITDCALVWASVHGPEPLIYTHRPRASRLAWPDILSSGHPNRAYAQETLATISKKDICLHPHIKLGGVAFLFAGLSDFTDIKQILKTENYHIILLCRNVSLIYIWHFKVRKKLLLRCGCCTWEKPSVQRCADSLQISWKI